MAKLLKKQARKLAKKGRRGDTHLLHITRDELMSLLGTGKVTRNPETGLPEAAAAPEIGDTGAPSSFGVAGTYSPAPSVYGNFSAGGGDLRRLQKGNILERYMGDNDLAMGPGQILAYGKDNQRVPFNPATPGDWGGNATNRWNPESFMHDTSPMEQFTMAMMGMGALGELGAGAGVDTGAGFTAEGEGGNAAYFGVGAGPAAGSTGFTAEGEGGNAQYFGAPESGSAPAGDPFSSSNPNTSFFPGGGEGMGMPGEITTSGEAVPGSMGGPGNLDDISWIDRLSRMGKYLPSLKQAGNALQIAGGTYGLYNAYQGRQAQKQQQKHQQEYYDRLNDLMANPGRVTSLPGYQFNLNQGSEALARRMASMGYGTSGNLALATQQFGSDYSKGVLGAEEQLLASQYGRASPPTSLMPDPTRLAFQSLSNMGYGFGGG